MYILIIYIAFFRGVFLNLEFLDGDPNGTSKYL
jgi:hypothetical protein